MAEADDAERLAGQAQLLGIAGNAAPDMLGLVAQQAAGVERQRQREVEAVLRQRLPPSARPTR